MLNFYLYFVPFQEAAQNIARLESLGCNVDVLRVARGLRGLLPLLGLRSPRLGRRGFIRKDPPPKTDLAASTNAALRPRVVVHAIPMVFLPRNGVSAAQNRHYQHFLALNSLFGSLGAASFLRYRVVCYKANSQSSFSFDSSCGKGVTFDFF